MASVTTTDVFQTIAALQAAAPPAAGTGTIAFVIQGGKAVQYVWLTTASGAPANNWYKVVAR